MAKVVGNNAGQGEGVFAAVVQAPAGGHVTVANAEFLQSAEYHRAGPDLILEGADGSRVLIKDFFSQHQMPSLVSADGAATIDGGLAKTLAGSMAPGQYAQAAGTTAQHSIGTVSVQNGSVTVKHADGSRTVLKKGDPVFPDDVIETGQGGAVGVTFEDGTTFSLGSGGRMVLDDLVYDPDSHTGSGNIAVLKGSFTFVSGQIPKTAPDALTVKTPAMSVGIRGTAGAGNTQTVVLMAEAGGVAGELVITTPSGQTMTINVPGLAASVSASGSLLSVQMSPAQVQALAGNSLSALPNPNSLAPAYNPNNNNNQNQDQPIQPPPSTIQQQTQAVQNAVEQALALQKSVKDAADAQRDIKTLFDTIGTKIEQVRDETIKKLDEAEAARAREEASAVAEVQRITDLIRAKQIIAHAAYVASESALTTSDIDGQITIIQNALDDSNPATDEIASLYALAQAAAKNFSAAVNALSVATSLSTSVQTDLALAQLHRDALADPTNTAAANAWRDNSAITDKLAKVSASETAQNNLESKRLASDQAAADAAAARSAARPALIQEATTAAVRDIQLQTLAASRIGLVKAIDDYVTSYGQSAHASDWYSVDGAVTTALSGYKSALATYLTNHPGATAQDAVVDTTDTTVAAKLTALLAVVNNTSVTSDIADNLYAQAVQAWIGTEASVKTDYNNAVSAYNTAHAAADVERGKVSSGESAANTAAGNYTQALSDASTAAVNAAVAVRTEMYDATAAQMQVESMMSAALQSVLGDMGSSSDTTTGTVLGDVAVAAQKAAAALAAATEANANSTIADAARDLVQAAVNDITQRLSEINAAIGQSGSPGAFTAYNAKDLSDDLPASLSQADATAQAIARQVMAKAAADYDKLLTIRADLVQQQSLANSYLEQANQAVDKATAYEALAHAADAAAAVSAATTAKTNADTASTAANAAARQLDGNSGNDGSATDVAAAIAARVTALTTGSKPLDAMNTNLGAAQTAFDGIAGSLGNSVLAAKISAAQTALSNAATQTSSANSLVTGAAAQVAAKSAAAATAAQAAADADAAALNAKNDALTAQAANDATAATKAAKAALAQASIAAEKAALAAQQVQALATYQNSMDSAVATATGAVKTAIETVNWAKALYGALSSRDAAVTAVNSSASSTDASDKKAAITGDLATLTAASGKWTQLAGWNTTYASNTADKEAAAAIAAAYDRALKAKASMDTASGDATTQTNSALSQLETAQTKTAAALAATTLSDALRLSADAQNAATEAQRLAAIVTNDKTQSDTAKAIIEKAFTEAQTAVAALTAATQMQTYASTAQAKLTLVQSDHATVVQDLSTAQAKATAITAQMNAGTPDMTTALAAKNAAQAAASDAATQKAAAQTAYDLAKAAADSATTYYNSLTTEQKTSVVTAYYGQAVKAAADSKTLLDDATLKLAATQSAAATATADYTSLVAYQGDLNTLRVTAIDSAAATALDAKAVTEARATEAAALYTATNTSVTTNLAAATALGNDLTAYLLKGVNVGSISALQDSLNDLTTSINNAVSKLSTLKSSIDTAKTDATTAYNDVHDNLDPLTTPSSSNVTTAQNDAELAAAKANLAVSLRAAMDQQIALINDKLNQVAGLRAQFQALANDAPVLNDTAAITLPAITEDIGDGSANAGFTVGSLIASRATDAETASASLGMALTGLSNAGGGTWWYTNGTTWTEVPADLGSEHALLLKATDKLRFVPNADWNSQEGGHSAPTITFHAWDGGDGAAYSQVDLHDATATGGFTAFSTATITASLTVSAVNDVPVLSGNIEKSVAEDGAVTFTASDFSARYSDVETALPASIKVLTLPTNGTLKLDGIAVTANQIVAYADLAKLTFVPNADWNGSTTFQWAASDGTTFSTTSSGVSITVTPENDAPVLSGTAPTLTTIAEDVVSGANVGSTVASLLSGHATDVDSTGLSMRVTATSTDGGTWQFSTDNGSTWNSFSSFPQDLAASASVRFAPAANWNSQDNSHTAPTITFKAWDGAAESAAAMTASVTVSAANDAPVINVAGSLVFDGVNDMATSGTVSLAGNHSVEALIRTSTVASWQGIVSSQDGNAYQQMVVNGDKLGVQISDAAGHSAYAQSTISVTDGQWHKVGYTYESGIITLYIDGVAAGTGSDGAISLSGISAPLLVGVNRSGNSGYFNGEIDEVRVWNTPRTAGDMASTWAPLSGSESNLLANWTFPASNSGADVTGSHPLTMGTGDTAPTQVGASQPALPLTSIAEDSAAGAGTLVSALTGVIQDIDGAGKGVAVTDIPTGSGTWQYSTDNGTSWSNFGAVSSNAALLLADTDKVRFVPAANYNGNAGFTWRAWDQTSGSHGTKVNTDLNGGTSAFSSTTAIAVVEVTPVNDAPVATLPTTASGFTENGTPDALFSTLTLNDIDNAQLSGATVTIASPVAGDVLNFTTQNGISGTYSAGVLTLSGSASVADYQAALRSVTFSNPSETLTNGSRTISLSVNDGQLNSTAVTATVTVTGVNDAPTITLPGTGLQVGGGTYANIPHSAALNVESAYTIEMWVKLSDVTSETVLFEKGSWQNDLFLLTKPHNGGVVFTMAGPGLTFASSSSFEQYSTTTLQADTWYHLAATWDGTTSKLYVNGTLEASESPAGTLTATTEDIHIGSRPNSTFPAAGVIDDVRLWNTPRDAAQVLADKNSATVAADSTLVAHWTFNEGTGTTAADSSGNGHDATLAGAGWASGISDNGTTTAAYTENGAAVIVAGQLDLGDVDNATLTGATVTIGAGKVSGDLLAFAAQNDITGSYNATTGVLTLSGTASVADYATALRSVTFSSTSDNPGTSRTISFSVTDGTSSSSPFNATIAVTPVNDAPTVGGLGSPVIVNVGDDAIAAFAGTTAVTDPDSTGFTGLTITLSGGQAGDILGLHSFNGSSFDEDGGSIYYYDANGVRDGYGFISKSADQTLTITFEPDHLPSSAVINDLIKGVTFSNTSMIGGTRSLSVTVTDDTGATSTAVSRDIVVNTPPTLTVSAANLNDGVEFGQTAYAASAQGTHVNTLIDDLTVELRFKWNGAGTGREQVLFYNGDSGLNGYGLTIAGGQFVLLAGDVTSLPTGVPVPPDGGWHHVALVRDGGQWSLYLDGAKTAFTSDITPNAIANGQTIIGNATELSYGFNGTIDDVAVWSEARTATEIAADQHGIVGNSNLDGHWGGNINGGTLTDLTANGLDLTVASSVTMTPVPAATAIDGLTVEIAFSWNGRNIGQSLFFNGDSEIGGYGLSIVDGRFAIVTDGPTQSDTGIAVPVGGNHDVALVRDGGIWKLYLDGIDQGISVTDIPSDIDGGFTVIGNNDLLMSAFQGTITSVALWNGARSASDITADIAEISPSASGLVAHWTGNSQAGPMQDSSIHAVEVAATAPFETLVGLTATKGTASTFTLTTSDDPDATITIIDQPDHGTITVTGHTYTYTPTAGYVGTDTFTVRAVDSQGASQTYGLEVQVRDGYDVPPIEAGVATPVDVSLSDYFAGSPASLVYGASNDMPSWLHLDAATGRLSGTPPGANNAATFTVTATDRAGLTTSQTITLTMPEISVAGVNAPGSSLYFGGGDAAQTKTSTMSSAAGTIELWVQMADWQPGTEQFIIGNGIAQGDPDAIALGLGASGLVLHYGGSTQPNTLSLGSLTSGFADGSWHHVAFSWEAVGNQTQLNLYVDGVLQNTNSTDLNIGPQSLGDWQVGGSAAGTDPLAGMVGAVDNVRLWNDVRTAGEIAGNAPVKTAISDDHLVADWRMDSLTESGDINDSTGNENYLHLSGATRLNPPGQVLNLNGGYVELQGAVVTEFMTIEAWVRPNQLQPGNFSPIYSVGTPGTVGYMAVGYSDEGLLTLRYYDSGQNETFDIAQNTGHLSADMWSHVAVVIGPTEVQTERNVTLYVNGVEVGPGMMHGLPIGAADHAYVGHIHEANSLGGGIADFRIYDGYRTPDDIALDMNSRLTGDEYGLLLGLSLDRSYSDGSNVWFNTEHSGDDPVFTGAWLNTTQGSGSIGDIAATTTLASYSTTLTVDEDTAITTSILAGDSSGHTLSYSIASTGQPSHGSVEVKSDGTLTYKPNDNYAGNDSFTLRVTDNHGTTVEKLISVIVNPVDDTVTAEPPPTVDSGALSLYGDTSVAVAGGLNTGNSAVTYEAWMRYDPGISGPQTLLAAGSGANAAILTVDGNGQLTFSIGGHPVAVMLDGNLGAWHHVAAAAQTDGAGITTLVLYLDGQVVATTQDAFTYSVSGGAATLGASQSATNYLHGKLSDVRVYTDALNQSEVQADMAGTVSDAAHLFARWQLNETNGAAVADSSGGTHTGTVTGSHYDWDNRVLGVVNAGNTLNISGLTLYDPDTASGQDTTPALIQVTLTASHGTIGLDGIPGSVIANGIGTGTVILGGSLADLNAALAQVSYTPVSGFSGNDTITVVIDDMMSGLTRRDGGTVPVFVLAVPTENNDNLTGSPFADIIDGLAGDDIIAGQGGADTLTGGAGDDTLIGDAGDDYLDGGAGNDVYIAGTDSDVIVTGGGLDNLIIEQNNLVTDIYRDGDDLVFESVNGITTIRGQFSSGGITSATLNLADHYGGMDTYTLGAESAASDLIVGDGSNDTLAGGNGSDILIGAAGDDTLFGGAGMDFLRGDAGSDTLVGGMEGDVMIGGAGADVFRFFSAADSSLGEWDVITDFTPGIDRLDLVGLGGLSGLALRSLSGFQPTPANILAQIANNAAIPENSIVTWVWDGSTYLCVKATNTPMDALFIQLRGTTTALTSSDILQLQTVTADGTAKAWDGDGGGDTSWSLATNWGADTLPSSSSDVSISGASVTYGSVDPAYIRSLTATGTTLNISNGGLYLSKASTLDGGSSLQLSGTGILGGNGKVTLGGDLVWSGGSILSGQGIWVAGTTTISDNTTHTLDTILALGGTSTLSSTVISGNGELLNGGDMSVVDSSNVLTAFANSGQLSIVSNASVSNVNLTTAGDLMNTGTITLDARDGTSDVVSLTMATGSSLFLSEGSSLIAAADGGADHRVEGRIDMVGGTITAHDGLMIDTEGDDLFVSSGTLWTDAAKVMTIDLTDGGKIDLDGTLTLDGGGHVSVQGFNNATWSDGSVFIKNSAALDLDSGLTLGDDFNLSMSVGNDGTGHLNLSGTLAAGGTFTAVQNGEITIDGPGYNVMGYTGYAGHFAQLAGLDNVGSDVLLDPILSGSGLSLIGRTVNNNTTSGGDNSFTGNMTSADYLLLGAGNDTVQVGHGEDVVFGQAGNDIIGIDGTDFHMLDGGTDIDTLRFDGEDGATLNLGTLSGILQNFEKISLEASGNQNLLISRDTILGMTGTGTNALTNSEHTMVITGNSGDSLALSGGSWSQTGTSANIGDGNSYSVYTSHEGDKTVTVYVDNHINTSQA